MKIDGLELLLQFAIGALKTGNCGKGNFAEKVENYLKGNLSLKKEIIEEIPGQLEFAWPILKTKDEPLSLKTVSNYVFGGHNKNIMRPCHVKAGRVKMIKDKTLLVTTPRGGMVNVNFFGPQNIKPGDHVAFHWNWLVCKITPSQFKLLSARSK